MQKLKLPKPEPLFLTPAMALRTLTSKTGKGVYASSDTLFKGAIFGRDSIEVAEDLLEYRPKLVERIILTLASLQGEVMNQANEEEPGKIVHEYRTPIVDNRPIRGIPKHIYEELSARWGGDGQSLAYYGSVDATPHFLRLLGSYTSLYGEKILERRVILRSGHKISMAFVVENALEWLEDKLTNSASGMLEYKRTNPHGIVNQVWKDSDEFYIHEDGNPANHDQPIASIEVQGLVYDALLAAAKLVPARREELANRAADLRDNVIKTLWLPEEKYFALGVDYDETGKQRLIYTPTANPAALLDTQIFDHLAEADKQHYVSSILRKIMGPDFLTNAGIRSRGLSQAHLVPFWDYHGSFVTWPKETYDIAKGIRRQGFPSLARELENRLLNVVLKSRKYLEFVYVDGEGRVLASPPSRNAHGEFILVDGTNKPERVQAWTVAAVMAIVNRRLRAKIKRMPELIAQEKWQRELEDSILTMIPRVDRLLNPLKLTKHYPTYRYRLSEKRPA